MKWGGGKYGMKEGGGELSQVCMASWNPIHTGLTSLFSLVLLLLLGISINNNFYNTINPSDHVCVFSL